MHIVLFLCKVLLYSSVFPISSLQSGCPLPSNRLNCGCLNPLDKAMLSNRSVKGIFVMVADRVDPVGMTEAIIFFKSFNCCYKMATAGST
ncbi:hypothetical protein LIER_27615 [Lithospermum erythrorhizon]|uniref:Secreted protein n=1 Tax=Lithospermum erythrorhizon TaxID=34254 RepID=A0AAV3RGA0_LITER